MNPSDLTAGFAQSIPQRSDLHARICDFLARKERSLSRRVESLLEVAETTLSPAKFKTSLKSLLLRLRSKRGGSAEEIQWVQMVEQIHECHSRGTIESYSSYLFTIEEKW